MANPFVLNFDSPNLGGIFQNNEARRREDRSTVQDAFKTLTRQAIEGSVDNDPLYADPIANAEEKVKRYTQAGMSEQAKQARDTYNNLVKIAADKDAAALRVDAEKDLQKDRLDATRKNAVLNATVTRLGQLTDSYNNLITQRAKLAAGNDLGNITPAAVAQIKDIDKRLAGLKSAFGGIVSTLPPELQSNYLLGQDTPPVPSVTQRASSGQPVTTTQPVETPGQLTQGILPAGGGGAQEFIQDLVRNAQELGGEGADALLNLLRKVTGNEDAEIFNILNEVGNVEGVRRSAPVQQLQTDPQNELLESVVDSIKGGAQTIDQIAITPAVRFAGEKFADLKARVDPRFGMPETYLTNQVYEQSYDDEGQMTTQGKALAAIAGAPLAIALTKAAIPAAWFLRWQKLNKKLSPKLTETGRANLLDKLGMYRSFDKITDLVKAHSGRPQATRVSDKSRWEILF